MPNGTNILIERINVGILVIIAGASASGKSYLLSNHQFFGDDFAVVKKKTTRQPRNAENKKENYEFVFNCTQEDVLNCEYSYCFRDTLYGFNSSDIDELLSKNKTPMIIIRKIEEIVSLKTKYKNSVAILCESSWNNDRIIPFLQSKGSPIEECTKRLFSNDEQIIKNAYQKNKQLFDLVLMNNYDESFLIDAKIFLMQRI